MNVNSSKSVLRFLMILTVVGGLSWAAPALAQSSVDVVTVGTVTATGPNVAVPVYIRDTSGTPLGIDQPAGSRIQSFSIKVDYTPSAFITGVTFTRAGITAPLTPTFESSPSGAGTISLIATFDETTNLIPFTSNAALPGNQIAQLTFSFASGTPAGTTVPLTMDATLTQLSNQGGTTTETVAQQTLLLVSGAVTLAAVSPAVPTLSEWGILLLAAALGLAALRIIK
jgi:hypothetical protein